VINRLGQNRRRLGSLRARWDDVNGVRPIHPDEEYCFARVRSQLDFEIIRDGGRRWRSRRISGVGRVMSREFKDV